MASQDMVRLRDALAREALGNVVVASDNTASQNEYRMTHKGLVLIERDEAIVAPTSGAHTLEVSQSACSGQRFESFHPPRTHTDFFFLFLLTWLNFQNYLPVVAPTLQSHASTSSTSPSAPSPTVIKVFPT
jgi:hypothetical protein